MTALSASRCASQAADSFACPGAPAAVNAMAPPVTGAPAIQGNGIQKESIQGRPGGSRLEAGQALTLQARQAGCLRAVQGRVWITFRHAAQDGRVRAGDHFLAPGERLALAAGETVVMESLGAGGDAPAWVWWEATPLPGALPLVRSAGARAGAPAPRSLLGRLLGLGGVLAGGC